VPDDPGGLIDREVLRQTFSTSENDANSFAGGLAWAFESPNIVMRVSMPNEFSSEAPK